MADLPDRESILELLDATLTDLVEDPDPSLPEVSSEIKDTLDRLLLSEGRTVRDGMLVLLAMEVSHTAVIDWREQGLYNPARWVSKKLGSDIYPRLHISGSSEALQTGVKGVSRYIDRSNETWTEILSWASEQPEMAPIEAAFMYVAAGVASTARNLPDMPALDTPLLSFATTFAILDHLLDQSSSGAYEQFVFAALLEGWLAQLDEPGVVETKNLNASDASAGTAGDVQHRHRGHILDAYEVTSFGYASKIDQAVETLKRHDLPRINIVAKNVCPVPADEIAGAIPDNVEICVLDIREETRSLVARLGKSHRRLALERLYQHLVEKQARDELVAIYVDALFNHGVVDPG